MSKWTHSICTSCWNERNPDRPAITLADDFREIEVCCFCGENTRDGIYIRANPDEPKFCKHDKE
jgi:hypothetical protein